MFFLVGGRAGRPRPGKGRTAPAGRALRRSPRRGGPTSRSSVGNDREAGAVERAPELRLELVRRFPGRSRPSSSMRSTPEELPLGTLDPVHDRRRRPGGRRCGFLRHASITSPRESPAASSLLRPNNVLSTGRSKIQGRRYHRSGQQFDPIAGCRIFRVHPAVPGERVPLAGSTSNPNPPVAQRPPPSLRLRRGAGALGAPSGPGRTAPRLRRAAPRRPRPPSSYERNPAPPRPAG